MNKRTSELRQLYNKGFDFGLMSEAEQMRTTIQMRELAIEQHKKHLAEIDEWLNNQESGLKRRIAEIEGANNANY
ncbi:hypothetical protein [uncultured Acinetobacter sp.]|uniref:hypothetical protein n=1 Tax=uncultured Acinetobacter sp. TaxID=165433 RepID=UPI00258A56D6|nr:hypothetical protein [uncultured Acinetobacter sp.]